MELFPAQGLIASYMYMMEVYGGLPDNYMQITILAS